MKDARLFRMLYYIVANGKVTANELAERFEVSVRTVYRDIDAISSAGIPIYALPGKGGGIEIDDGYILNKALFSNTEQNQIISAVHGLKSLEHTDESELLTKLAAHFKTKNVNWIEVDFTDWRNDEQYEYVFSSLKTAILNRNQIIFSYFSNKGEKTTRQVKPIRILFKGHDWYLYAFCMLRNSFRYFKLSRISNLKISPDYYEDDFDSVRLEKDIKDEKKTHIKVKFDNTVAFRIYDELGGNVIEDEEGNLYAEFDVPVDFNLYYYILTFGDHMEVLEPKEVREQIKELLNKMIKKYNT